jgi:hypothetical protein
MTTNHSIINFNILDQIQTHIFANDSFSFRMACFKEDIDVYDISVPDSFDDDVSRDQLKKAKIKTPFHAFNILSKNAGLIELSEEEIAHATENGLCYWYIQINYRTGPAAKMKGLLKSQPHTFIVILFNPEGSDVTSDFKLLYCNNLYSDYTRLIREAVHIDENGELNEEHQKAISNLELILGGICRQIGIEIPIEEIPKDLENLLVTEITAKGFEEMLRLLTRGKISGAECEKKGKSLLTKSKKSRKKADEGEDDFQFSLDVTLIVGKYNPTYYSDWKFDPEDIAYGISEMLGKEFTFKHPKETYRQDLFPFIQKELSKSNLEMMTFNTQGDSYEFILVEKDKVEKIISLAQKLRVEVERLD